MHVESVTFSLRNDIEIPNKNITAHLLQANLRASADKLLDKFKNDGLLNIARIANAVTLFSKATK